MRVIQKPVAAGKTYDLMQEFMADPQAILIVMFGGEKRRLENKYRLSREDADRILVFYDGIREKLCGRQYSKLLLDDADHLLASVIGRPVDLITLT